MEQMACERTLSGRLRYVLPDGDTDFGAYFESILTLADWKTLKPERGVLRIETDPFG